MNIISGFLCILCFCLMALKSLTRKLNLKRADRFLMKIHKPVSATFIFFCILHIILVSSVFKSRNIFVYITGIVCILVLFSIIILYHMLQKSHKLNFKWHRILFFILFSAIICHIAVYYAGINDYKSKIHSIHINNINTSKLPDGTYMGEYDAGYIYAKVEVSVKHGMISNINILKHRNERGGKAEKIIYKIIDRQKIDVDSVSGATNSSMVIKKAVENALENPKLT